MPLIHTKNLRKAYETEEAKTVALHGVSFDIEAGEFVAVMGPSGSGKSTLLHLLGFLDDASGGTYLYKEKNVGDYSDMEKAAIRNRELGFVFQSFNLLPKVSVLENVKLPLSYSSVPERVWNDRAKEVLESVGLSHRLYHEPSELSGGEKQRVAIARALVTQPSVIFADEPTGNLDSKSGRTVMEILQKLHSESKHTVILITHETYTAEHAERIIRLKDGEIESDRRVDKRLRAADFIK